MVYFPVTYFTLIVLFIFSFVCSSLIYLRKSDFKYVLFCFVLIFIHVSFIKNYCISIVDKITYYIVCYEMKWSLKGNRPTKYMCTVIDTHTHTRTHEHSNSSLYAYLINPNDLLYKQCGLKVDFVLWPALALPSLFHTKNVRDNTTLLII